VVAVGCDRVIWCFSLASSRELPVTSQHGNAAFMHLKSLELVGFKSFADKTVFEFHEGVTAIVGPNGCGKSNVLDAVRWVLGEQSAKALRGGEMADVIFNGTDTRKPVGYGEVSLTFSDCGADLGVDWNEVRVTRRIYRDGNSDYLLNKTICRLKDIQNLFADTGVGRTAYSMMEQGRIDLILSSRPEDRRTVFEEAAGITKYKSQKKEALRKLEATEANLLRAGDIIKEVKRQIGSLQRQAGKARRYQALHADLRVLDTHFAHRKMQTLERDLGDCGEKLRCLAAAENKTRSDIEENETRVADLRAQLDEIDAQISQARADLQRHESEIASHRHRVEFNEQRGRELRELIAKHEAEISAAEAKLKEQQSALRAAAAFIEETARLLSAKQIELDERNRAAAQLRAKRTKHDNEVQELQLSLAKDEIKQTSLETELANLRARRDASAERTVELRDAMAAASSGHEKLVADVTFVRSEIDAKGKTLEQLSETLRDADRNLETEQNGLRDAERELAAVDRSIADKQSRMEVLRQLNDEGEGLAQGSQALLKGTEFADVFDGALAAHLDVEPEFVPALEAAFGRSLHVLVLKKPDVAAAILAHVTEHRLGHAALLLDPPVGSTPNSSELPQHAIAWASDKMKAPAEFAPFVQRLLHNVAIFRTLDDALHARRPGIAAATLNGEFISHEGVLFGGSVAAGSNSILERKSRIALLETEYGELTLGREALAAGVEKFRERVVMATSAVARAKAQHASAVDAQSGSAARVAQLEREHAEASHRLEMLRSEMATLDRQLEDADANIAELTHQIDEIAGRLASGNDHLLRSQTAREEAMRSEEAAIAQAAELRLAVASHEQRRQMLFDQQQPLLARGAELSEIINARRNDIATYEQRIQTGNAEVAAANTAIETQAAKTKGLQAAIGARQSERSALNDKIAQRETELRAIRNRLNELHDARATEQVRQSQLQMELEHLAEHVTQRYHLNLREFEPDPYAHEEVLRAQIKRTESTEAPTTDDTALQQIIAALTRQLDAMGPVNLDAVHEYDELEERHKFLETQMNDLTNGRRELLDVIARINSTTQKLFAETFAQVRVNFREMFAELFGGGRADLALLDENDPLNCGIDIIAKPPGKQLQSVSLLSGGERTMTAVALLFAIYMVRPSPFCILDEMDAPLDESNINRFIKMLDRFVEQSQFIIITHNKRTIAKADILYGVTMEERGISKLVGMKMAPAPAIGTAPPQPSVTNATQQHFAIEEAEDAQQLARR